MIPKSCACRSFYNNLLIDPAEEKNELTIV